MRMPIRPVRLTSPVLFAVVALLGCGTRAAAQAEPKPPAGGGPPPGLMTPASIDSLPRRAPDRRIAYGEDPKQYGELRVPAGGGPHPLVVLVHGGCFKAAYATAEYMAPIGDALKDEGIASWSIEYRRLGDPGGGWPGTYRDVGRGIDLLRSIAGQYGLDLSRVVVVGHSAGGHLAMWAAGRSRLPRESPLYSADPLPLRGAVDLAGPVDMSAHIRRVRAAVPRQRHHLAARRHARHASGALCPGVSVHAAAVRPAAGAGARHVRGVRADAADARVRGRGACRR
jgi:acetyl esterase/lipase